MTLDDTGAVFYGTIAVTAIALAFLITLLGTWTATFFARNRVVRHNRGESITTYYRHHVMQPLRHAVVHH